MSTYTLGIIPVAIVADVVGSILGSKAKTSAAHISDRVQQYQGFTDDKLRDIIRIYGGEMGEAAKQVLDSRGSPTVAPIVVPTGTVTVTVPSALAPRVQLNPGTFDLKNPLVLGGIAAAVVALGFLFMRKR